MQSIKEKPKIDLERADVVGGDNVVPEFTPDIAETPKNEQPMPVLGGVGDVNLSGDVGVIAGEGNNHLATGDSASTIEPSINPPAENTVSYLLGDNNFANTENAHEVLQRLME